MQVDRIILPLLAFISLFGTVAPASAQTIAGRYRLSLATGVLSYDSTTIDPEGGGADTELSTLSFGVPRESASVRVAYGVSPQLVLGGAARFTYDSTEEESGGQSADSSEFGMRIGPRLEYLFGSGNQPFVFAEVGFARTSTETEGGGVTQETTVSGFYVQGGVGLRYAVSNELSFEPEVAISWGSASGEQEQGGGSLDFDASTFAFGVNLAVSVWP